MLGKLSLIVKSGSMTITWSSSSTASAAGRTNCQQ